jgi:CheY-like chemotaxis protein
MRLLVVATDVTADVRHEGEQLFHREQIERASRLAALGELVGGVAHELNNPLTAILGFTEILAMNDAGGPAAEDLGVIQKEALRARDIVRDLLFIAQPGATERALVSLTGVVDHIGRLRRAGCLRAGITFESTVTGECFAWGNEHQLTQVLLNLVTNAEQALADQPQKEIRIGAESDGTTTTLVVADTGVGMDAATRDRAFEPFFTTKQGEGTGLGLSLSYSIVRAHQGDLRVESTIGGGSRFIVTLPARAPDGSSVSESPERLPADSVRVLVVDDEPSLRKVCRRLLTSMGHECETAETSAAAIALAEGGDFDVVLCDYRLANETANDVIEGFLRVAPQLVARMVITTGATTDAGVVELTERYGLRLIAKPYGAADLATLIQRTV